MSGEEIFHLSVSELAKRIEAKKLSPVELTQIYLDRSQKLGPRYNAYALLTPEIALEQAKAAEKEIGRGHYRGPLYGIPYAAKDLLAVKGLPTTWGAKPYAKQVFDYNATVIEHLNRVGAVMIGKAAMIELAGGMGYRFASASLQGEAKNPWDTTCWTCGSSSGSGAIVAAGLAAFAIGTVPIDKAAFTSSPSMELHSRPLKVGWITNAWKSLAPGIAKPIEAATRILKKYFSGVRDVALPVGPWEEAGSIIVAVECAAS